MNCVLVHSLSLRSLLLVDPVPVQEVCLELSPGSELGSEVVGRPGLGEDPGPGPGPGLEPVAGMGPGLEPVAGVRPGNGPGACSELTPGLACLHLISSDQVGK